MATHTYNITIMAAASNRKSSVKEYRCNTCGKAFDSAETLNSHISMEHSQKSHAPAGVG
jgi:hypothetical protein